MSRDDIQDENTNSIDDIEDLAAILGRDNLQEEKPRDLSIESDNEVDDLLSNYGVAEENTKNNNDSNMNMNPRVAAIQQERVPDDLSESAISPVKIILWLLAYLLLIVCLFVQYAIFNINTLVKDEGTRSTLVSVCKVLSCSIPSADVNNLRVIQPDYRPSIISPSNQHSDIVSKIINVSDKRQLYPNLQVVITDQNGGVLGDFVAKPKDYLVSDKQKEMATAESYFMFTVPVPSEHIYNIDITPFY